MAPALLLMALLWPATSDATGGEGTVPEPDSGLWTVERAEGEVRYVAHSLEGDKLTIRCPLGTSGEAALEAEISGRAVDLETSRLVFEGAPHNPESFAEVNVARPGPLAVARRQVILRFLAEHDRTHVRPAEGRGATFETAGPGDDFAPCRR